MPAATAAWNERSSARRAADANAPRDVALAPADRDRPGPPVGDDRVDDVGEGRPVVGRLEVDDPGLRRHRPDDLDVEGDLGRALARPRATVHRNVDHLLAAEPGLPVEGGDRRVIDRVEGDDRDRLAAAVQARLLEWQQVVRGGHVGRAEPEPGSGRGRTQWRAQRLPPAGSRPDALAPVEAEDAVDRVGEGGRDLGRRRAARGTSARRGRDSARGGWRRAPRRRGSGR